MESATRRLFTIFQRLLFGWVRFRAGIDKELEPNRNIRIMRMRGDEQRLNCHLGEIAIHETGAIGQVGFAVSKLLHDGRGLLRCVVVGAVETEQDEITATHQTRQVGFEHRIGDGWRVDQLHRDVLDRHHAGIGSRVVKG